MHDYRGLSYKKRLIVLTCICFSVVFQYKAEAEQNGDACKNYHLSSVCLKVSFKDKWIATYAWINQISYSNLKYCGY